MTSSRLTGQMFSTNCMREIYSDRAVLQGMLDFEAALARAEAAHDVIPTEAATAIATCCDASRIDAEALATTAAAAGNLAIPLVRQLTLVVAQQNPEAAKFVHWGATSQDAIDTGAVLQLRSALTHIDTELALLGCALAQLAQDHRATMLAGRTWMQHALPIPFGLKAAGWLDGLLRHQDRLAQLRERVLVLQFGGAAGTLASLGARGLEVAATLAKDLGLRLPDMPWHTQRDHFAETATVLGLLTGSLGKMARDISLHMQTEVAELSEPAAAGRGGSSTMPHKRNPVGCAVVLSASVRVPGLVSAMLSGMVQEHERALGGWQAEWDTLPQLMQLSAGALQQMRQVMQGLNVDPVRMRSNLDATGGLIMAEAVSLALGRSLGRMQAHAIVEQACHRAATQSRPLRDVLADTPEISSVLGEAELDQLFDPAGYSGVADEFTDRVLDAWRRRKTE